MQWPFYTVLDQFLSSDSPLIARRKRCLELSDRPFYRYGAYGFPQVARDFPESFL